MVTHIVLFKIKEEKKAETLIYMKENLEGLIKKISQIKSIKVSINSDKAPKDNYDIILNSTFDSFEDLDIYQQHPAHNEVVKNFKPYIEKRAAVDF